MIRPMSRPTEFLASSVAERQTDHAIRHVCFLVPFNIHFSLPQLLLYLSFPPQHLAVQMPVTGSDNI